MEYQEAALSFACHGDALFGIVSLPQRYARRGVLMVVGGPQYRVGSHRQFTQLARTLASEGVAVMRFDYRGMGDSEGEARDFQAVDDDLHAAIDQFLAAAPGVEEVVIWGLCDAASAALFYAGTDSRVSGLVLLNPWVRTVNSIARTTLKHYYRARLFDPGLWKKIAGGRFNYRAAGAALIKLAGAALRGGDAGGKSSGAPASAALPLPERMLAGWSHFRGKVLLIISEPDLTAKEFLDLAAGSPAWQALLKAPSVTQQRLQDADHTFSRRVWKDQVARWTGDWLQSW
jgi:exosortase A-associated hydrolase 1